MSSNSSYVLYFSCKVDSKNAVKKLTAHAVATGT